MTAFLVTIGVIALIVWGLRAMRQKELAAFRESDIATLQKFSSEAGKAGVEKGISVEESLDLSRQVASLPVSANPVASDFELKSRVLDELHAHFFGLLDAQLPPGYHIFVQVPVSEFIRSGSQQTTLFGKQVSFLVCRKPTLEVVFGLSLKGGGQTEQDRLNYLRDLFRQINRPLLVAPMQPDVSGDELAHILAAGLPDLFS